MCVFSSLTNYSKKMKRSFNSSKQRNIKNFYVLSSDEMLKVRGGSDTKPPSREKYIFDLEDDN
jgi:hypothetical protein